MAGAVEAGIVAESVGGIVAGAVEAGIVADSVGWDCG